MSLDHDFEQLVRRRLHDYADHAPTTVADLSDVTSGLSIRPIDEPPVPKRRIAGIGALVIALGGGAALTGLAVTGRDEGGANTPQEAVGEFIVALEDRDALGAVDSLDPAESRVLVDIVRRSVDESRRVGLLSDDADASAIAGTTVAFEDLTLRTETVATDLSVVHLDAGSATLAFDLEALPLGGPIREVADLSGDDRVQSATTDLAENELVIATVDRDGRWYVSLGYTIGENARRSSGMEFPMVPMPVLEASDSPEAAATAFWTRLVGFDVGGVLATMAPGESDALLRYSPLFAGDLQRAADEGRADGLDLAIDGMDFEVRGDGDRRTVSATAFTIAGTLPEADASFENGPPFDPSAPTVIFAFDEASGEERFLVIPAGDPVPETVDADAFETGFPDEELFNGPVNNASLDPSGGVVTYWSDEPAAEPSGPQSFSYTLADGCATIGGEAVTSQSLSSVSPLGISAEQLEDGSWRSCDTSDVTDVYFSLTTLLFLRSGAAGVPRLPSIETVEIDGGWYVSPYGSIAANLLGTLEGIDDGQIMSIDSPIAFLLYGTDRTGLEAVVVGRAATELDGLCDGVVEVGADGIVTGLADSLEVSKVQDCYWNAGSFGWTEAEIGFEQAPADFEFTVPASVPDSVPQD